MISRFAIILVGSAMLLLASFPAVAPAAWGQSGCGPVGSRVLQSAPARQGWELHQDVWYFYRAGKQIAGYNPDTEVYRTYDAGKDQWGEPRTAPWLPGVAASGAVAYQNFGLDLGKLLHLGQPELYSINGKQVTARQAADAMTGADLADDSNKLRLTVIGTEADRKAVLDAFDQSPVLATFKDKILVHGYAADHWAVARSGFVTTGKPTVYMQAPDGKVLHRQDDFVGGAEALAEAIRKVDPSYDPKADKDQRKSDDDLLVPLLEFVQSPWAIVSGIAALILALRRKVNPS
jgi:hypothetical protein